MRLIPSKKIVNHIRTTLNGDTCYDILVQCFTLLRNLPTENAKDLSSHSTESSLSLSPDALRHSLSESLSREEINIFLTLAKAFLFKNWVSLISSPRIHELEKEDLVELLRAQAATSGNLDPSPWSPPNYDLGREGIVKQQSYRTSSDTLSIVLHELHSDTTSTDFVIRLGSLEFHVHKYILASIVPNKIPLDQPHCMSHTVPLINSR